MTNPKSTHIIIYNDSSWMPGVFPNSEYKMLWTDGLREVFCARFGANSHVPLHQHPGREFTLVLEGEMYAGDDCLGPGDFLTAGSHDSHEIFVPEFVSVFIMTDQPIQFVQEKGSEQDESSI